MDRSADWRVIEPEHDPATPEADDEELSDEPAQAGPAAAALPRSGSAAQPAGRRTLVAAIAAAGAAAAIGLAVWTSVPQPELIIDAGASSTPEAVASMPATEQAVVIDVQGAVVEPGLHRLQPGMRVGDAIAAAGGYAPQVDLAAAAEVLNLAELLSDGAKIHVPARGEQPPPTASPPPAAGAGPSAATAGGLIDINRASESELDTLPGIGPVTAGKIIAAREEAPFQTVDELLGRKVVGPATFEKIRELVSVGR